MFPARPGKRYTGSIEEGLLELERWSCGDQRFVAFDQPFISCQCEWCRHAQFSTTDYQYPDHTLGNKLFIMHLPLKPCSLSLLGSASLLAVALAPWPGGVGTALCAGPATNTLSRTWWDEFCDQFPGSSRAGASNALLRTWGTNVSRIGTNGLFSKLGTNRLFRTWGDVPDADFAEYYLKGPEGKYSHERLPSEDDPGGNWGSPTNGVQMSVRLYQTNFTTGDAVSAVVLLRNVGQTPFEDGGGSGVNYPYFLSLSRDGEKLELSVPPFGPDHDGSAWDYYV